MPLAQQHLVLEYRMDRTVATADEVPVVLGRMPESFVAQMGGRLRAGKLLRFRLGVAGIYWRDSQPVRRPAPAHACVLSGSAVHAQTWGVAAAPRWTHARPAPP